MSPATGVGAADRVLPVTRVLAGVIIPFLVLAAFVLLGRPHETGRLFAWPINPPMTAIALGATYTGGIVFFTRAMFARRWSSIALGFPAVVAFATTLGIVTVIHWDRFSHDLLAFWLWAGLYFTTPALVLLVWLANSRAAPRTSQDPATMPQALRAALAAVGGVLAVTGLVLLLVPEFAETTWAWTLSPLTSRTMAATFFLPAVVMVGIALDGRWSSTRIPLEAQGTSAVLALIGAVVRWEDLQGPGLAVVGFFGGLAALLVLTAALYSIARRGDGERNSTT